MGFLELCCQFGVSHEVRRELREPLVWCQGSQASMRVARGSASLLSRHGRGLGPQDALGISRFSRVAAGNPGFPRLLPVTSGSFSGCL